jgi:tetratricopeptide (TPR) repeat protein
MFSDADKVARHAEPDRPERRKDFVKRSLVDAAIAARRDNDLAALARTLIETGRLERSRHRLDAARRYYEEAVAAYRKLDEPLRLAHTIRHVGDILQDAGQLVPAEPCYVEALAIYRQHPETPPLDLANAIRGFALLKGECSDIEVALALWRQARELYAAVKVQAGVEDCDRQIARLSRVA